jgi:hypothetical protein
MLQLFKWRHRNTFDFRHILQVNISAGFEVFTAVTIKNFVFCDTEIQFVLRVLRTHYVFATEPSRLMLCKI